MSYFRVVLDACTLFPASLRDTLLRVADAGLYRLHLTDKILEEVHQNLIKKGIMQEIEAKRLVAAVKHTFPESFMIPDDSLILSMPINQKDRHVLAAAVASGAQVVVTQNLKDFPPNLLNPFNVKAESPDDFLVNLFDPDTEHIMIKILIDQASDLRNPPKTVLELLDTLNQHAPNFVVLARKSLFSENIHSRS